MSASSSSSKTLTPTESSRFSESFRSNSSKNIESLYEITHLPVEQIPETKLAITNPYHVFKKPSTESFTKRVRQLVSSDKSKLPVKEFVQCTPFDSLFVKSGHEEQFFTVPIPPDIVTLALSQGYTHMHFGAIRFAVTFHGRKGLQAVARIALVDSKLTNYQQAILGNVQTTLNAGTVFFTLYPNFNVPLSDPFVCSALKIQVQITGVSMVPGTAAATIHQQMVYRVQNHSYDLCIPGSSTSEALMLTIDSEASHTAKYVPKQLTRAELVTLLPEVWVTSYEKLQEQNNTEPLQQVDPTYLRRADKQIEMRFNNKASSPSPERNPFQTDLNMMQEICKLPTDPILENGSLPIWSFNRHGKPVYQFSKPNKHIPFDVCYCDACEETAYEANLDPCELRLYRKKKAGKALNSQELLEERYKAGDPTVDLLGEPSGKFNYYVTYGDKPFPTPSPETPSCQPPPPPEKPETPKPTPQRLSPYAQKALKALGRPYKQYQPVTPPIALPQPQPQPEPISCYLMSQEPTDYGFPPQEEFDNLSSQTTHKWKSPLQVPHSDGSNAKIIEWFPTNLAKSIREPYNVNFVIFLQNMCAKNGVDFNKVPEYVKYDDPWKNHDEANPPLFERLFNYAERHNWSYGEISSDSDAFVGMDSTDEEDEGVNVAAELDDLAFNSDGDGNFDDEPNTPIYGGTPDHYWDYDDDGNETD
ncbi:hypothetical protein LguiB_004255 [Lonicera macranthoides]